MLLFMVAMQDIVIIWTTAIIITILFWEEHVHVSADACERVAIQSFNTGL